MKMKSLSEKQLQVMELLWKAGHKLDFEDIWMETDSTYPDETERTLRRLTRKGYIAHCMGEDGTVFYLPRIPREDYIRYCLEQLSRLTGAEAMREMSSICCGDRGRRTDS